MSVLSTALLSHQIYIVARGNPNNNDPCLTVLYMWLNGEDLLSLAIFK